MANLGDVNLAGISFTISGYNINGSDTQAEICARSVYASQSSFGVGINCRFRTLFGNATLTTVNSGAILSFNGEFLLDSGATVTVAGNGETAINNLTTAGSNPSATVINKTDAGILTLTGWNTAFNTTINVNAGTLQVAQASVQGNTNTVVGPAGVLSGGGISGTIVNRGLLAPSTNGNSIFTLTIGGKLTCPLDTSNPSYVQFLIGGANPGQYSGLILQGDADFGGSYLRLGFVNGYLPPMGTSFTLATGQQGTFSVPTVPFRGFPEGSLLRVARYVFSITYKGGPGGRNLTITRVPTPKPALGDISRDSAGVVKLPIYGFSGEVVQVESSPDLQTWSPVQTLTLSSSGTATFTQTAATPKTFYRVRPVEP